MKKVFVTEDSTLDYCLGDYNPGWYRQIELTDEEWTHFEKARTDWEETQTMIYMKLKAQR